MKPKIILIWLLSLTALVASAQEGGIRGKVVSRIGRSPIPDANVILRTEPIRTTVTDAEGVFRFTGVAPGDYRISVSATDFQTIEFAVKVQGDALQDINFVTLSPEVKVSSIDDSSFAEFDTESSNDAQSTPVSLSASKDIFDNISAYQFGELRFRPRGYETSLENISLNGLFFNDAMTGYTAWSLWGGLNEVTRNQEVTSGLTPSDYAVGDINGTTNIDMRASQIRKGFRASLVNASGQYRARVMATYASGQLDNGWAYAFSASTRQGGNNWVKGVYYNAFSYYAAIEKQLNSCNSLALTVFGAPTIRGVQAAATQETYDLVGSNYYNPNWGYQDGKKRNARVRNNHEPVAILNYTFQPHEKFRLNAAVSYRFGRNGYSALDWYQAADPRPDYYRNLPSYYPDDPLKQAYVREGWLSDWNIRQINWDAIYNANYQSYDNKFTESMGLPTNTFTRSQYVLEERMTNQQDLNGTVQILALIHNNSKLTAGINYRWNRTEYFKRMKDLLGGDYWVDIDKFAQRDVAQTGPETINNLNSPFLMVGKGDKYGYDYYGHLRQGQLWANYGFNTRLFEGYVGAQGGHTRFWRQGRYRKGLFPNNSFGDSEKQDFWTYMFKGGVSYKISAANVISINAGYTHRAPYFYDSYVSPRSRNSVIPGLTTEKSFSGDLSYSLRTPWFRMRVTGYYTEIRDQCKLISFYDDVSGSYTNFAMSGINQMNAGVEFGMQIPLTKGLTLQGAVNYGYYKYTSNPLVTQTIDNSDEIIVENERVYWKNYKVGGTPQTAVNLGLSYRTSSYWFFGVDANYYNAMYIDMNPIYRTDYAHKGLDYAESQAMASQERFPQAYVLNANLGKSWMIDRKYNLGVSLQVNNLLNRQNIKSGGYEQMRLHKVTDSQNNVVSYTRFDSKYFYLFGTTYYLNLYFRF